MSRSSVKYSSSDVTVTHLRCQTPPLPQARVTGCGAAAELPGLALASLLTPGVIVMLPAVISEDYYIINQFS